MRVHGGRWCGLPLLWLILLAVSVPQTSTRKILSSSDLEEKSADEGLLPFITSTLAPLTDYIFGRNEKDGNENGQDSPKESNPHNIQDTSRTSQPELPDIDLRTNVIPKGEDSEEISWNEITKGSDSAQRLEDDTEQTEKKKKKKRQWNKSANSLLERLEMQEDTEKALIKKQNDLVNDVNDEEEKMKNVETKVEDLLKDSLQRDEKATRNKNSLDFSHFDKVKGRDLMMTGKEKWTGKMGDWKMGDNTSMMVMDDRRYYQPGLPVVGDLERYMRTCDNCLVQWDSFQCPLNDKAIELKKWITEWEKILSFGCQLRDGCDGTHKCCHSRDPAFERALKEMTDMARQMYNTFQSSCSGCPRHGGWGDWCEWSGCSTTCGPGTRTRSRQCNNPTPKGSGRQCEGPAMDFTTCYGPPCCMDGNWAPWSSWGSCSASCGTGMRERSRTCSNPPPNYCGRTCPGPDREMGNCQSNSCCIPQNGNWGLWTPWSQCSASCGPGSRERSRRCNNPPANECGRTCPGSPRDTDRCDAGNCCVDGNWGQWNSWSTPLVMCGLSRRERRRRCDSPPANNCGRPCPGRNIETDQYDTGLPCITCVDGNWGSWQRWSRLTVTCGVGERKRRRSCNNPSPNYCGVPCPGRDVDTQTYDTRVPCVTCVDGNWGQWNPWSTPLVTCGVSRRERRRRCDSPPANDCGRSCPGRNIETDQYDTGVPCITCVDGNWGSWQRWGTPTVTCGVGQRDRRRSCNNPSPNYCGVPCPGRDVDTQTYDTRVNCRTCTDGNWGWWQWWGPPTVMCGVAERKRRRFCDNPRPNYCGRTCPGPDVDKQTYDTGVDCSCLVGNWLSWGPWSNPPATRGATVRERTRRCDSPPANNCESSCPGSNIQTNNYTGDFINCAPQNGTWGKWSQFSTCEEHEDMTCTWKRTRLCNAPPPNICGHFCEGDSENEVNCTSRDGGFCDNQGDYSNDDLLSDDWL